jgi:O-succinylbenzoic acid--CoA ligase
MSSGFEDEIRGLLCEQIRQKLIIGQDNEHFRDLFETYCQKFKTLAEIVTSPQILLAHRDPWHFLAALLAAIAQNCPVFLCNPHWQQREWEQVGAILQPNYAIGHIPDFLAISPLAQGKALPSQAVMIPTGGSSGKIRFAIHSWQTLSASVQGFCQFFEVKSVNSCCVLPLYHVSGLMQFLRSFVTQGQFWLGSHKTLQQDFPIDIFPENWFISLVPSQLQDLLLHLDPVLNRLLTRFGTILLGGAPVWESLLTQARISSLKLALTYGMTETGSQVVTLKPQDFLKGHGSSGQVLPHAVIQIQNEQIQNEAAKRLPINNQGIITIKTKSQYLGYYPHLQDQRMPLLTDDLGFFDRDGYLYICGRISLKIISGGENIYPIEVESALFATKLVQDVAVVGIPDRIWGQAIAAIYVPASSKILPEAIKSVLKYQISGYKIPKYWLWVERLPRNSQGKLSYPQLTQWAIERLKIDKCKESS